MQTEIEEKLSSLVRDKKTVIIKYDKPLSASTILSLIKNYSDWNIIWKDFKL